MEGETKRRSMYSMMASQLHEDGYIDAAHYVASATHIPQYFNSVNYGSLYQSIENNNHCPSSNTDQHLHGKYTVENFVGSAQSITHKHHRDFIEYAAFPKRAATSALVQSPDGSLTSSSTVLGEVYLYKNVDVLSCMNEKKTFMKKAFRKYTDNDHEVICLGFHQTENLLFSGNSASELKAYSFRSEEHTCACQTVKDSSAIKSIITHPSGSYVLYSTQNGDLRFYNVERNEIFSSKLARSSGKPKLVGDVGIHPFGTTLATITDGSDISVLDGRTTKQIDTIQDAHGNGGTINSLIYSKSGNTLLTAGSDNNINLWDLRKLCTVLKSIPSGSLHSDSILRADFTWDEQFIICNSSDSALVGIDVCSEKPSVSLPHPSAINAFSVSKVSNTIVTSGSDMQLRFWDSL